VQNTTGQTDPILEISPDDGLFLNFDQARVTRGSQRGIPIYAKLRDSNGDPLPLGTSIRVQYEPPGSDTDRSTISEVRDNIQPYHNLSIRDQQDEEFIDAVKIPLDAPVNVRSVDTLHISIESSTEIDWDESQLYIEGNAVVEVPA